MAGRARIHDTLDRLERWLRANQPAFFDAMRPGATDAELDDLEQAIGRKLPEDVRAFYKWRAGMPPGVRHDPAGPSAHLNGPFWYGYRPMLLSEIRDTYAECCALGETQW